MQIVKYGDGASSRPFEKLLIINSGTAHKGGVVKLANKGIDAADAVTDRIYGICRGFVVANGNTPIENALASQHGATLAGAKLTAAANNETVKPVYALVEPVLPGDVIRAEMDDALGTTTGSNLIGYHVNVLTTDERKLDESTTTTGVEQFIVVGQPGKGRFVDVKVTEAQLF